MPDQWGDVATQDWFRSATPEAQQELRVAWIRDQAPQLYGQLWADPNVRSSVISQVAQPIPAKLPDEDEILTPDTLRYDNYAQLEANPKFAAHSYEDQQTLRWAWFTKAMRTDPKLASMTPQEQQNVYNTMMKRSPSGVNFTRMSEPTLQAEVAGEQYSTSLARKVVDNLAGSIAKDYLGLSKMLGLPTPVSSTLQDGIKELEYINQHDTRLPFLTQTLPNIAGSGLEFVSGAPAGGAMELLGGKAIGGLTKGVAGLAIEHSPGLLELAGKAVGAELPSEAYRIAAQGAAGAGAGILQNKADNQPLTEGWLQNAAMGLGFGALGEIGGNILRVRKSAKDLGMNPQTITDYFYGKFDPTKALPPEMVTFLSQNPAMAKVLKSNIALHKSGLPLDASHQPDILTELGKDIGLNVEFGDTSVKVTDPANPDHPFIRNISDPKAQADAVWEHFDANPKAQDYLDKTITRKTPSEYMQNQPELKLYKGGWIPAEQRSIVMDNLNHMGMNLGMDFKADPHGGIAKIDQMIGDILKPKSDSGSNMEKLAYALRGKYGLEFSVGQVRKLWNDVRKTSPVGTHVYVDAATGVPIQEFQQYLKKWGIMPGPAGGAADVQQMANAKNAPPVAMIETSMPKTFSDSAIFTGSAADMRSYLNRTLIKAVNEKAADTRQERGAALGGKNIKIEKNPALDLYTVEMTMPSSKGPAKVFTSFQNPRDLYRFLQEGGRFSKTGFLQPNKGVFLNRGVQASYQDFVKDTKRGYSRPTDYLPYTFLAKTAADNGWHLSTFGGKYHLTDALSPKAEQIKKFRFDTLNDVAEYIRTHNVGALPDLLQIPATELNEAENKLGGSLNPFDQVQATPYKANRRFGIVNYIRSRFSQTQYMTNAFAHIKELRDAGIDPTGGFENLRTAFQAHNAFLQGREYYINHTIAHGVSDEMSEDIWRYVQAFDNAQHANAVLKDKVGSYDWETKRELEAEWKGTSKKGLQYIATVQKKAAQIHEYLDGLFSLMHLDKSTFVYNYFPRMAAEIRAKNIGPNDVLRWNQITSLTDAEKKAFFEFARGNDPVDFAYDTNIKRVLIQYTNLAGRRMYVRPMMKIIKNEIEDAVHKYESVYGPKSENVQAYIDYTRHIFANINGLVTDDERAMQMASKETYRGLKDILRRGRKAGGTGPNVDQLSEDSLKEFTNAVKNKMQGGKMSPEDMDSLAHLTALVSDVPGETEEAGYIPRTEKGVNDVVSKVLTAITAGVISFKPELITRNFVQSLTVGAPLIGISWWNRGFEATLIPGNMERIRRMGLTSPNVNPIGTGDLSTKGPLGKAVEVSMYPHKYSDMFGRSVVYLGMEARARSAIDLLDRKQISPKQFQRLSGMQIFGPEFEHYALELLDRGKGRDAFVNALASKASDQVNYIYQGFDKPQMFNGIIGRMFGQFGTWPINYVNFALNQVRQLRYHPTQAVSFLARSAAVAYAIQSGFNRAGIEATPYIPWETMFFTGGPYYSLMNDLLTAGKGDSAAASRAITGLKALIPFSGAASTVDRSLEAALDGDWYEAFINLAISHPSLTVFPQRQGVIDQGFNWLKQKAVGAVQAGKDVTSQLGEL